jgi:hypothetical protein
VTIGQLPRPIGGMASTASVEARFKRLHEAYDRLTGELNQYAPTMWNPLGWGAKGDEITDDTAALEAMIAAAPDGTTFQFSKLFYTASGITVTGRANLTFLGPGGLTFDGVYAAITFVDCTSCDVTENFKFDGQNGGGTGVLFDTDGGNSLENRVTGCEFTRVKIGIDVQAYPGQHDCLIAWNRIVASPNVAGSIGVRLASHDNRVFQNIIQGFEDNVTISRGSQQIVDNHFYRSPSSTMVCNIRIASGVVGVIISLNYFDGYPTEGDIVCEECSTIRGISVVSNYFLSTTTAGPCIAFQSGSAATNIFDWSIIGNMFISSVATKTNAIDLDANTTTILAQRLTLQKNVWRNCTVWSNSLDDVQQPTYAATLTVTPMNGCTFIVGTLTGGITISNPSDQYAGGLGTRIRFIFTQDGTGGRNITFNGEYTATTYTNVGNTANTVCVIEFVKVASQWLQTSCTPWSTDFALNTSQRAFFTSSSDVSLSGLSGAVIVGGDGTGAHIAIDANEIMAKTDPTTAAALEINAEGGDARVGAALTTGNVSTAIRINSGTNAGANNATAQYTWQRGGTELWGAGLFGGVSTDGAWRLRDIVNGVQMITAQANGGPVTLGGEVRVSGDTGGAASTVALTNTSDLTARSTGVGTILFDDATNRDSAGFIRIYVGTTAYYVPIFAAI